MLEALPIQFEEPAWLLLLVLLVPTWIIARLYGQSLSRGRRATTITIRTVVILILASALARPTWIKRSEAVTVTVISDVSRSIPLKEQDRASQLVQTLLRAKPEAEDRVAAVTVAQTASPATAPHEEAIIDMDAYDGSRMGTNLAAGIEQALSFLPVDTANRMLLVSDGNQTMGNLLEAADVARANGIPIDVIPIRYEFENEVLIESVKAPTRARLGQTIDLRVFFRSQRPTTGRLTVTQNDVPIILDPESGATAVRVTLPAGPEVLSFPISLDSGGAHRFNALFEPDAGDGDGLLENNRGAAVSFVSGDGRVLIIEGAGGEGEVLQRALKQAGIETILRTPDALSAGAAYLNGFDAVVLANVPRWSMGNEVDSMLRTYVHDLGGGLTMLGGNESFGAGGWIDSETAKAMPIRMDPPQQRQMVRGALALIMHSTELPRANFWGQQTATAAIEALTSLDYIGIISLNPSRPGPSVNGVTWALPMQEAGDKSLALSAAKSMGIGDMPDFQSALELAWDGLDPLHAGQKHVIIISDGDPSAPTQQLIEKFADAKITITTIMFAGHGTALHRQIMNEIAATTGGRFYNEPSPKNLPKIFNKEASVVSRSLINEGEFDPIVQSAIAGPTKGIKSVPMIRGYVLTTAREGGTADIPIVVDGGEGEDPLFANWNYGLGKSIAFMSDLSGRWCASWSSWAGFQRMWEQSIRWSMRPASPSNVVVRTKTEGDLATIDLEAIGEQGGFANFLETDARVLGPDGSVEPLSLQQVGPGRYRGEFSVSDAGAYLVNVAFPVRGDDGAIVLRNVQGAVSVPYPKEFRAVRDNAALLRTVAERTGGRVIELDTVAESINLFERESLEIPLAPKRIWDLLAVIAAGLFLLDVAVRRIAFDSRAAREAAARAMARTENASEASVDAWKRSRARARRGRSKQEVAEDGAHEQPAPPTSTFDVSDELEGNREGSAESHRAGPESHAEPKDDESALDRLKRARRKARGDDEENAE